MKELSIEEKAKLYDEAKARISIAYNSNRCTIGFMNEIFPELKESADKMISKELLDYLYDVHDDDEERARWINWLEKQSETFTKKDVDDAYLKGVTDTKKNEIEKQYEANYQIRKDIATFIFNYRGDIKDKSKWMNYLGIKVSFVENQGEKPVDKVEPKFRIGDVIEVKPMKCHGKIFTDKPNKIIDITEKSYILDDGKAYNIELQDGWKLSEQKPADKVEPKFKVGDWIICCNYEPVQIISIRTNAYEMSNGDIRPFWMVDNNDNIRLWTVEDTKVGDVLIDEDNNIGIYKEIEGLYWYSYIYLGCDGKLRGFSICGSHKQANTRPATKGQYDTLMKAMTDAGYIFDSDKKELKKIVAPIFNIGDIIAKKHNSDINNFGSFTITDITGGKYWYNDRIICDITEQDNWELVTNLK